MNIIAGALMNELEAKEAINGNVWLYGYVDIWVVAQMGWNMAGYVWLSGKCV